jgi:putative oxidoreductase
MKDLLHNSYINLIFRIILGTLFLLASTSKAVEPAIFAEEIANYKILPELLVNIMAITFPWIELICAVFIITGVRLKSATFILGLLLIVFSIGVFIAMAKGLNINCGCHTQVMAEEIGMTKLIENTGLLLITLYIFFSNGIRFTLERYIVQKSSLAKIPAFRNLN